MGPSLQPFKYAMTLQGRPNRRRMHAARSQPSMSLTIGTTFSPYSSIDRIMLP